MTHLSILGQNAHRFAAQLLPAASLTLVLVLVSPAVAQPLGQAGGLEPSAPDNLRCPGRPGPEDGFHFESEWQNVATYAGPVLQIALDHSCNLFVVDPVANQVVKYNADGQQVATTNMLPREPGTDPVAGVAVAQDGTIYVADPGLHQVRKLSPSGQELATWKSCDCVGQPGWMVAPVSIAIDGTSNNVYVLDQSADTLDQDEAAHRQEDSGLSDGREHLGSAVAPCPGQSRRTLGQYRGEPGQGQAGHVREHVARVG